MQQKISLAINSIQHVGLPVTDLNKSVFFYEGLGFDKAMEKPFEHNGETGTCIMMKRGDIVIELYQMPAKELPAIRNRKDGHIDHIAFDVPDINETFFVLKKAGYNIIEPAPVLLDFWENGCRYFNMTGPDGERLEFNQVL